MPTSPGYCGLTVENMTIGCGQNCPATARVLRPRPHREVEDDDVDVFGGHAAAVADGDVVLPDHRVAGDDLEAVGLQALDQRIAELAVDGLQRGLQERPAVAKVEHADADGAMRKMREHENLRTTGARKRPPHTSTAPQPPQ